MLKYQMMIEGTPVLRQFQQMDVCVVIAVFST